MLLMMDTLFPEATSIDIARTRIMLGKYKEWLDDLISSPVEQQAKMDQFKMLNMLERAVNAISDREIRGIMQYRYIQGNERKVALVKYPFFTDRTFDRKIVEGCESVANSLKTWGCL
ncbi:hypothetical protein [Paenibacillus daejeonensis]|uniref:hypothetical protein n=1 Tax=Paenibacillus daejeonensis TaxID=135193 RepID=UPI00038268CD|nr:hypothetical protein [Paenibacillus daejeonensis]